MLPLIKLVYTMQPYESNKTAPTLMEPLGSLIYPFFLKLAASLKIYVELIIFQICKRAVYLCIMEKIVS
jgi:hypothetical protein